LWPLLSNELGLTLEQEEKLKQQFKNKENQTNRSERRKLSIAMVYLERLRQSMMQRAGAVDEYTNTIRNILTPSQNIRFLGWMETNRQKLATAGFDRGLRTRMPQDNNGVKQEQDVVENILAKPDETVTIEEVTLLLSAMAGALPLPNARSFGKGIGSQGQGGMPPQQQQQQQQQQQMGGAQMQQHADNSGMVGVGVPMGQQQQQQHPSAHHSPHFNPMPSPQQQQQVYSQQHDGSMHPSQQQHFQQPSQVRASCFSTSAPHARAQRAFVRHSLHHHHQGYQGQQNMGQNQVFQGTNYNNRYFVYWCWRCWC
jgi:hypothetical protein